MLTVWNTQEGHIGYKMYIFGWNFTKVGTVVVNAPVHMIITTEMSYIFSLDIYVQRLLSK